MTLPFAATSPSEPVAAAPARLQRTEGVARIAFKRGEGGTRLDRLFQSGAAKIKLPRVAAGQPPEAVLINTAGGLTGGDRMGAEIAVAAGCSALVTTQACEKIYRAASGLAEIRNCVAIADGARLDWLPQEAILFDGARLARHLDADLGDGAELLAVEAVIFGRTARGETIRAGLFADRWRIRRNARLLYADDLRFDWSDGGLLARPAVLAGAGAMATIVLVSESAERHLDALRGLFGSAGGASTWNGKLVARLLADDGAALRRLLIPALGIVRDGAPLPRIWRI